MQCKFIDNGFDYDKCPLDILDQIGHATDIVRDKTLDGMFVGRCILRVIPDNEYPDISICDTIYGTELAVYRDGDFYRHDGYKASFVNAYEEGLSAVYGC